MRSRLPSATIRISIQALRGEGDVSPPGDRQAEVISIHALRGEGDLRLSLIKNKESRISIHALRGEGDLITSPIQYHKTNISIHALRGEGDHVSAERCAQLVPFQSTPSVGRATNLN